MRLTHLGPKLPNATGHAIGILVERGVILQRNEVVAGKSFEIKDLAGDGDHYAATVASSAFKGLPRVRQHQMVYAALQGRMGGVLHALALTTVVKEAH